MDSIIITLEDAMNKYKGKGQYGSDRYNVFSCAGENVILIKGNVAIEQSLFQFIEKIKKENDHDFNSLLVIIDGDLHTTYFSNHDYHLLVTGDLFCDEVDYDVCDYDCTILGSLHARYLINEGSDDGTLELHGETHTPFVFTPEYAWGGLICVNSSTYLDEQFFENDDENYSDYYGDKDDDIKFHFIALELPDDISEFLSKRESPFPQLPTSALTPQEKAFLFRDKKHIKNPTFDVDAFVKKIKSFTK